MSKACKIVILCRNVCNMTVYMYREVSDLEQGNTSPETHTRIASFAIIKESNN